MSKLPLITVKNFEKLLFELGFEFKRQKRSHVFSRHPDGRYTLCHIMEIKFWSDL